MAAQQKGKLQQCGITDVLQVAEGLYPYFPLSYNYLLVRVQDVPSEDLVSAE